MYMYQWLTGPSMGFVQLYQQNNLEVTNAKWVCLVPPSGVLYFSSTIYSLSVCKLNFYGQCTVICSYVASPECQC